MARHIEDNKKIISDMEQKIESIKKETKEKEKEMASEKASSERIVADLRQAAEQVNETHRAAEREREKEMAAITKRISEMEALLEEERQKNRELKEKREEEKQKLVEMERSIVESRRRDRVTTKPPILLFYFNCIFYPRSAFLIMTVFCGRWERQGTDSGSGSTGRGAGSEGCTSHH